jgi:hypothetical protein
MSFLGLDLTVWTAIAAFGGVALAAATVTAIIIGIRTARADRERDDAKRAEDRQWDSDRRAEDRERDDRLRREAADEWDRRNRAEQRAREDHEARQVTTEIIPIGPLSQAERASRVPQSLGRDFTHRVVVSAPTACPVKGVDVQIVHNSSGNVALRPGGHSGDPASTENGRVYYRFWAEIPEQLFQPFPIVRFVDQHGNLYYSLRGHTSRFPQSTDPSSAAVQLDKWIRTGPRPDGPDA